MDIDLYRAQFAQLNARPQPAWLVHEREDAFDRFAELGWPTLRDEDWKYTNVSALAQRAFRFAPASLNGVDADAISSLALDGSHLLVFINGRHVPALSRVGSLPSGAHVGSLAQQPERAEALRSAEGNGLTALNAACWADGALIDVAAGVDVAQPIQLLFISTEADLAVQPRNLIRVGAGGHVDVIEHAVGSDDAAYLSNSVTQIELGAGASVVHTQLQEEGRRASRIAELRVEQGQDSRFTSQSIAFGALLARSDITTRLAAPGCEATLLGLTLAGGRQHIDHHTRIDHLQPRGTSREVYKGVLDGAARTVFNGRVIVHIDAQKTDAQQSNRNLLLSDQAEADTKPQLEIYADDVQCRHGATVGQLDPEQLYYLRSRGVDAAAARALLTYAFAAEVVERMSWAPLRARIEQLLRGRLGDAVKELA
jgi:Fe-S cluster assembly protein SufD